MKKFLFFYFFTKNIWSISYVSNLRKLCTLRILILLLPSFYDRLFKTEYDEDENEVNRFVESKAKSSTPLYLLSSLSFYPTVRSKYGGRDKLMDVFVLSHKSRPIADN